MILYEDITKYFGVMVYVDLDMILPHVIEAGEQEDLISCVVETDRQYMII